MQIDVIEEVKGTQFMQCKLYIEHTQYKKHTQGFFRAGGSQKEPYIPYETGVHIQRGDNRDGPAVRLQGGERRDEQDTGCQRRGRVRAFQGGTAGHAV